MKPEEFLKKYFLEKMSKNEFLKINKKDLLSEGILDSLDIDNTIYKNKKDI